MHNVHSYCGFGCSVTSGPNEQVTANEEGNRSERESVRQGVLSMGLHRNLRVLNVRLNNFEWSYFRLSQSISPTRSMYTTQPSHHIIRIMSIWTIHTLYKTFFCRSRSRVRITSVCLVLLGERRNDSVVRYRSDVSLENEHQTSAQFLFVCYFSLSLFFPRPRRLRLCVCVLFCVLCFCDRWDVLLFHFSSLQTHIRVDISAH